MTYKIFLNDISLIRTELKEQLKKLIVLKEPAPEVDFINSDKQ